MSKNLMNYCTSCGNKVEDFSEKCSNCEKHPYGGKNNSLSQAIRALTMNEQKFLNNQYCINCGISVKELSGEYTEIVCPNCGVNPFGMGKEFREEITINYCENCGKEVNDRDEVCSCGRLPYQLDNKFEKNGVDMTEEDWETYNKLFKTKYCKECGFNHNNDSKYDYVNEETGEVYIKCPKCGSHS